MRYDPERDIAPPPLGSWWKDRITGQRVQVMAYQQRMGRYVETVQLRHVGSPDEARVPFAQFRAEYVSAPPP